MKYITTLFLASLITFVAADDNKDKHKDNKDKHKAKHQNLTSDERSCQRMWKLNHANDVVANSTRMAELQRTHPERAQKIKDQAATSGPELQKLSNNATLAQICVVFKAHEHLGMDCHKLNKVERLQNNLKNGTAVKEAAKHKGKTEDEIRKKWQADLDSIKKMKDNSTLVKACDKVKKKESKDGVKQKNDAAGIKAVGTGAFALGLGLYAAAILF